MIYADTKLLVTVTYKDGVLPHSVEYFKTPSIAFDYVNDNRRWGIVANMHVYAHQSDGTWQHYKTYSEATQ